MIMMMTVAWRLCKYLGEKSVYKDITEKTICTWTDYRLDLLYLKNVYERMYIQIVTILRLLNNNYYCFGSIQAFQIEHSNLKGSNRAGRYMYIYLL
jgi:hypothetical protein